MPFIELTQQIKTTQIDVDDEMSSESTNPVQNCVITEALSAKADEEQVEELANKMKWITLE